MSANEIRIEKMSLRLRGVTPQQAEQRARSIAHEIADSLVRERALLAPGQAEFRGLSVRVKSGGGGLGIGEQLRQQLRDGRTRE
jgi:hypothetical protein